MTHDRPYSMIIRRLREAGMRPTRQRMALSRLLMDGGDRHICAEDLHEEATAAGVPVSLATVYNTLHQFTACGLLREVVVGRDKTYFDTNITEHHHFYNEADGTLIDIPGEDVAIQHFPAAPDGLEVSSVDLVVRISQNQD